MALSDTAFIRPTTDVGEHPVDQFAFLLNEARNGRRCALVTIVNIIDSASRNLGAHMAVCEDGRYVGSVSSGCVDANVATVALEALRDKAPKRLQLGAGSGFVDIKLPCGGGLDLLINPDPSVDILSQAYDALEKRRPVNLQIAPEGLSIGDRDVAHGWRDDGFAARYQPNLKLILAGRGAELTAFVKIARAAGYVVDAYSPDPLDVDLCATQGAISAHLQTPASTPALSADRWTAVILLFHDHDWEPALIEAALDTDAFYIGALGSAKTHATRIDALLARGADPGALARVKGPIGLVPSMRNAPMLAISTLAEIVGAFNDRAKP